VRRMSAPEPVKLFVAILYREPARRAESEQLLEEAFGPIDVRGTPAPFDHTDYYTEELGPGLSRVLVGFVRLVAPGEIVAAKWDARELEARLAEGGRRRVNLDVGYLDAFKFALASFKGRGNKVYLDREVWLDVVLYFEKGKLHSLPWTFPDFRAGKYDADLLRLRTRYREQLRERPFGTER
jgi:hypothetical protein